MSFAAPVVLISALAGAPTVAFNGHLPSPADSAALADLGATAVRMDFNWFQFQPEETRFDWAYFDTVVTAARANNLRIYATVAYTPQWASSMPGCTQNAADENERCENKRPADPAKWAAGVSAVVQRYASQVECWGIWNEPNLRSFFQGTMDQWVNEIFLPAAAAIRAADPNAKICGPELAGLTQSSQWNGNQGTCAFNQCIRNGWERDLGQLLDRIGPHLDVITQHTYKADAAGVMKALLDGETTAGVLTHDSIRHVIESKGYGTREFWLTETGWEHPPQGNMSEADVATRIVDLFAKQEEVCAGTYAASLNDGWPQWTRTYYFHFPYDPGSGWGIVGPNQAPLAPYNALKNWAMGRTTSVCGMPGAVVDAGVPPVDAGIDAGVLDAGGPPVMMDAGAPTGGGGGFTGGGGGFTGGGGGSTGGGGGSTGGGAASGGGSAAPTGGGSLGEPPTPQGCGCSSGSFVAVTLALALARRKTRPN